jgi:hypothetical protein
MPDQRTREPEFHALLIGVDNYTSKPLHGCVNDIDAVQRLLIEQAGIPAARITRLASPHPDARHETSVPTEAATLANVRTAFAELGSDDVAPDDRVFIYYAGHGGRQEVVAGNHRLHRESLLPVDFNATSSGWDVLYDFELNQLIAAITARTRAVTLVLDCCHSTGATRDFPAAGMTGRFIDFERDLGLSEPVRVADHLAGGLATVGRGVTGALAANVDDCHIVAACLNHEIANESTTPDGVRHGLLTRAFIRALGEIDADEVNTVPWGRLWNRMRAEVETANPSQHLWMAGNPARAVLAGPPVDGDVGLAIARAGADANEYRIEAGSLAGVTVGARLAVYGERPSRFPPLGSDEDLTARVGGVLVVTRAARATATALADSEPFELPPGARARLVASGEPDRLRCAVVPEDRAVVDELTASSLLQVTSEQEALARLERQPDDTWALTDDVHGAREGYPVLFRLQPQQLNRARDVLEHYVRYAAPIRMARLCTDLPAALQASLLECPKGRTISPSEAEAAAFPEFPLQTEFPYELTAGDEFCVRVRNSSHTRLRVTLLNSAASGRVQLLGDQEIDAGRIQVFWYRNELGHPFVMSLPDGSTQSIDRFVVIGTTVLGSDLKHLAEDRSFASLFVRDASGARDAGGARDVDAGPPADQWTATEVMVRTRIRS